MLQIERQEQILQLLREKEALRIPQIAKALYVSEASVRRDLKVLESRGLLRRVYGGVVLEKADPPLDVRRNEQVAAKREIAERAAQLIRDGMTVFLDASSTAFCLLPYLERFSDLTVITNSHSVVDALAGSRHRLICTGGTLIPRNLAYAGRAAEQTLENYCPDLAFFSSLGVDENGEITDSSEEETALRKILLRHSIRTVFLYDSGKVGKRYLYRLANLSDMSVCLTNH